MTSQCSECGYTVEVKKTAREDEGQEQESYLCPMCDSLIRVSALASPDEEEVELRFPHRRILVVEDSRSIRGMLKDVLEGAGLEVVVAEDGEKALDIFQKTKPDLVLLDLKLPKKSGFDVLREAKESGEGKEIPFLVMSAIYRDPEHIHRLRELGACGFIDKDNVFDTVLDRIHLHVSAA
ncbi:MAG: response regulator [Acidobacteriota bacterium]|nr:MAG: response regulator [Acidobacteriota bacterium]